MPTERVITYSPHLLLRIRLRGIPHTLPKRIYKTSKERYADRETGLLIAVGQTRYKGKVREVALIYKKEDDSVSLITIHPLKPHQKLSRIHSGRWQPL